MKEFGTGSQVPISGNDFAIGKDTMYYNFISTVGNDADTVKLTVLANSPYFQLTKTGTMKFGSSAGVNMLVNGAVTATDAMAMMVIDSTGGKLMVHGGAAWNSGSAGISFVPSSLSMLTANNSDNIIAEFNAGTKTSVVDPSLGVGVYDFKIVNAGNTYYGIVRFTSLVPGASINYQYLIGNLYSQFSVLK